jgi:hypothetical protein
MMTGYPDMSSGHVDMTNMHAADTWRCSFRVGGAKRPSQNAKEMLGWRDPT